MRVTEEEAQLLLKGFLPPVTRLRMPRKKPTYKTPESAVKAACMAWLAAQGVFAWRNNSGGYSPTPGRYIAYGLKGSADIIGMCKSGRFLAIECKSDVGTLSDDQKIFRANVERNGGLYIVARSVDKLEAFKGAILGGL